MSWLGVNLNDSINNLKGQLSNFTRDVLSEDFVEGEDDDTQVVVPRDRIKELESLCQLQKHELEELKRARAEVEERLHAADLHAAHQNKLLKQQLHEYEKELRIYREKCTEWSWEASENSHHDSNHKGFQNSASVDDLQNVNHHNHHPPPPSANKFEVQNKQLSRRVEELEQELGELRDAHQEQVAALQDQHRQQILALKSNDGLLRSDPSVVDACVENEDGLPEQRRDGKEAAWQQAQVQLEKEKEELIGRVEILQRQVQHLKGNDDKAKQLEQRVSNITEECTRLKGENEHLTKNLEDLDVQHQAVIDQILKKKQSLQEEVQASKTAHSHLEEQVAQHFSDKNKLEAELEQLKSELLNLKSDNNSLLNSLKEKLEAATHESEDLKSQLLILHNKESSQRGQLQEVTLERDQLSQQKDKLEKELLQNGQQLELQTSTEVQQNSELENVKKHCLEMQQLNIQLKSTVETITEELTNQRAEKSNVEELLKLSQEKSLAAESEIVRLKSEVSTLTEKISKISASETDRKSQREKFSEAQQELRILEEKLSAQQKNASKYEDELKVATQALQDANSRTEILESELQAKVQELEISNERISELQTKSKNMETDLSKVKTHRKEDHDQIKKLLTSNSLEVTNNTEKDLHKLGDLVRDSIWQRDTLERHISTLTQELREKNEQLQEAESARSDLERECEDLRDQLEEIQQGIRPQPEGSSRGLPTIEEESEGCAEGGEGGEGVSGQAEGREQSKTGNEALQQERASQIEALQAQVQALSEARRNLETEVANMRAERETLQGQLREAEGRTGNLLNLETEAATLRAEKNALEMRLSSLTQQVDLETVTLKDERDTLEEHVASLELHIGRLQAEMTLNKHERDSIGQQLLTQYDVVEHKEAMIRVLEAELEGLKDTMRDKFVGHRQECDVLGNLQKKEAELTAELNSVRSQIIFKEDKIDELSQVLEQVGEIFSTGSSNPDGILQHIRQVWSTTQSRMKEQEHKLEELRNTVQNEKEQMCKKTSLLESECSLREEKEQEVALLKDKMEKSEMEVFQLRERVEELGTESSVKTECVKLQEQCNCLEVEKSEALANLNRNAAELQSFKEEFSQLQQVLAREKEELLHLQQEKESSIMNYEQQIAELKNTNLDIAENSSKLAEEHKLDTEERENRITSLQNQLMELRKDNTAVASYVEENEKLIAKERQLTEEMSLLQQKMKAIEEANETIVKEREEVVATRDMATQQLNSLKAERDQMIATITQKHQESVAYHAEIQRLMQVLNQTIQASSEEKNSLLSQLKASEASLTESRAHVARLQEELGGVKKIRDDLQQNVAKKIVQETEVSALRKEIDALQSKNSSLEQERDQLRIANAHFNTQYQDQSKELSSIREKEGRLAAECERLRQHLVKVEESYTAEAIKAEERENTLRSTLNKMEEKLNNHSSFYNSASQRASVQVETLQEQLREISAERDNAIHRLHAVEELSEQHQHSLATLQQVLQDFQKGQIREISEATERTRRQLDEERENSRLLTSQISSLKAQLTEVQSALAAASRLGEQLDKKEQMILALKAQVTSQEEVARKARDEAICLKTSSEGKIEKTLLRNLLVGYFATPNDKRQEVLRVIAEVLDFSGEERMRTGLDLQGKSWLSSITNFLAPPASNVHVTSKVDVLDHTSLSQAFIRFLEDESTPRPQARLPAVQMAQQTEEKAEKKAQAKAQAANKINPFVSVGETTSTNTNPDRSRNSPLLAAASAPPTLPTFTPFAHSSPSPVAESIAANPATTVPVSEITTPVSTNKYLTSLLGSDGAGKEGSK